MADLMMTVLGATRPSADWRNELQEQHQFKEIL